MGDRADSAWAAPGRVRKATADEADGWARMQLAQAAGSAESDGYFPRYTFRDPGPDGLPDQHGVRTVSLVTTLPRLDALSVTQQAVRALGPWTVCEGVRFQGNSLHLTAGYVPQGRNAAEDEQRIVAIGEWLDTFRSVCAQLPPIRLTVNGLTLNSRQLMATYEADEGWHAFTDLIDRLEVAIPSLCRVYDLRKSPLELGGKALQSTIAVFDKGLPLADAVERVKPFLPGPDSAFVPRTVTVSALQMLVFEHSPSFVIRPLQTLATGQLADPRPAAAAPVTNRHLGGRITPAAVQQAQARAV